jgi:predicted Rossmann-fold nucleotide-binding protein
MEDLTKICFVGSSEKAQAEMYRDHLIQLGNLIGHHPKVELICGGYFESAKHVIEGYQSQKKDNQPLPMGAYFVHKRQIKDWNEPTEDSFYNNLGFSRLVWTEADETLRAIKMIRGSDIVIALSGRKGTKIEVDELIRQRKPLLYLSTPEFETQLTRQEYLNLVRYSTDSIDRLTDNLDHARRTLQSFRSKYYS